MNANFTYEIVEQIGTIAARGENTLEINIVSWNGRPPKIDIREWNADHSTARKGLTLTHEEAASLAKILQEYYTEK